MIVRAPATGPGRTTTALRRLVLLCACLAGAALGGCKVDTVHPIVPVAESRGDADLHGVWRHREQDEVTYLHIGAQFAIGEASEGQPLRIVIVDHKPSGVSEESYVAYAARVGGQRYLCVVQEANGRREGYLLVRYRLADRQSLRVATVNGEALRAAIRAGKIQGTVRGEGLAADTTITAEPAAIAAFLASAGDGLFNPPVLLRRVAER